jgi:lipopolysaccharide biosynthesis glycosyltransferase
MPSLDVVYCVDDAFVLGAIVSAVSVARVLSSPVRFHVIDGGLTASGELRLREALARLGDVTVYPVPGRLELVGANRWYSSASLGRLHLSQIIPHSVDRIVYLDADTLVLSDLAELSAVDLGPGGLGAVVDPWAPTRRLGLSDGRLERAEVGAAAPGYFNAGVLVVDMVAWRAANISERAIDMYREHAAGLRSLDQDVLNILFAGRWTALSRRWNKLIAHPGETYHGEARLAFLLSREGIIHYSGPTKPWKADFPSGALRDLYRETLDSVAMLIPRGDDRE